MARIVLCAGSRKSHKSDYPICQPFDEHCFVVVSPTAVMALLDFRSRVYPNAARRMLPRRRAVVWLEIWCAQHDFQACDLCFRRATLSGLFRQATSGRRCKSLIGHMWVPMYRSRALTGGDDGLSGIELRPIFGIFSFDMFGKTGFVYSLAVLTLCMFVLRLVMRSPFGLT
jgi:hypothetical protein